MNQRSTKHDPPDDPEGSWLDADAASSLLGVKRQTLYAYVSRGRVESRGEGSGCRRTYRRADLMRLKASKDARAGHGAVAAGALRWGEPVLDSAITRIVATGPVYRGHPSIELAAGGVAFERVAELLFGGSLPERAVWSERMTAIPFAKLSSLVTADATPLCAARIAMPALAMRDGARFGTARAEELRVARRIVCGLVASLGLVDSGARVRSAYARTRIAEVFAVAFGIKTSPRALAAIDRALIVCADHELNASSFACRVAASSGADLYACASAALATLGGPRHGGLSRRVEALCDEVTAPGRATRVVRDRLRRGDPIPGFGHPLYPDGDPRAEPLMAAARGLAPRSVRVRILDALIDTLDLIGGGRPTLDIGLVALAAALGLGHGGATALFAAGRSAGWLAHALEQRDAGWLLRPRARYTGR